MAALCAVPALPALAQATTLTEYLDIQSFALCKMYRQDWTPKRAANWTTEIALKRGFSTNTLLYYAMTVTAASALQTSFIERQGGCQSILARSAFAN